MPPGTKSPDTATMETKQRTTKTITKDGTVLTAPNPITGVPAMLKRISKQDLPVSDLLTEDLSQNNNNNKPRVFMAKKTQKMYVQFPNGDYYEGNC